MLIACKSCRRQYDVEGMKEGEQVRCRCGELCTVPKLKTREARVLHCSGCGGKLKDKGRRCDYCGAEITLLERNLGPPCPECFARLPGGAKFCSACGIEIRPEAIRATRASASCPRCKRALTLCEIESARYTECGSCGGIWLDAKTFEKVVSERDTAALASSLRPLAGTRAPEPESQLVQYVPCPVCGALMHRKNFAGCSGVIIDWCKGHGFWFDPAELEKVIDFINTGGLDKMRQQELQRAKQDLERIQEQKRRAPYSRSTPSASSSEPGIDLGDILDGVSMIGSALWRILR